MKSGEDDSPPRAEAGVDALRYADVMLGAIELGNDGLSYRFDGFRVEVGLTRDGRDWFVRIEVQEVGQFWGNGRDPQYAFRTAVSIAQPDLLARGKHINWEGVEAAVADQGGFDMQPIFRLTAAQWGALGISTSYPKVVTPHDLEAALRGGRVLEHVAGVRSPHWHVISTFWSDFGRELCFVVALGFTGAVA